MFTADRPVWRNVTGDNPKTKREPFQHTEIKPAFVKCWSNSVRT